MNIYVGIKVKSVSNLKHCVDSVNDQGRIRDTENNLTRRQVVPSIDRNVTNEKAVESAAR